MPLDFSATGHSSGNVSNQCRPTPQRVTRSTRSWQPNFFLVWEPRYKAWWGDLGVICRDKTPRFLPRYCPFAAISASIRKPRRWGALLCSVLMHVIGLYSLLFFPFSKLILDWLPKTPGFRPIQELERTHEILYFPVLRPRGPGGTPGRGTEEAQTPKAGNTIRIPQTIVVSNPPRPDNRRQTIQQPLSPPELKIPFDVQLPNLLITKGDIPPPPLPRESPAIQIDRNSLEALKPIESKPMRLPVRSMEIPQPTSISAEWNLASLPEIPNPSPRLPVPPPPIPGPVKITVEANLTPVPASSQPSSRLPIRSPMPAPPPVAGEVKSDIVGSIIDLIVMSVDPGPIAPAMEVPAGNRAGSFSITGEEGGTGAPGGVVDGGTAGGIGGIGSGGDRSTGIGVGTTGGGGGPTGADGTLSVEGSGDSERNDMVALPNSVPPNWIFPITSLPATPRSGIMVSTGPVGGGGLGVYGVLRGGRIATTYLPMPGKTWILQYSPLPGSDPVSERNSVRVVSPLQNNLTPPWPTKSFDFRRPAIPPKKPTSMIILHGQIQENGKVKDLEVHLGIQKDVDQLALAAFSQWIFQPATRAGKPTAVEILVGIPVASGGDSLQPEDSGRISRE